MRVGLVIYGDLNVLSGGYLYDRMLVRALAAAGHHVEIYALPWRSYPRHLADNANRQWLARLRHAPVDLMLQDELNHPSLLWANRQGRQAGRAPYPTVSIVHHLRSSEPDHPPLLRRLYRKVERLYLNSVDAYVANSCTTHAAVQALLQPVQRSRLPALIAYPAADHLPAPEITAGEIAARSNEPGPVRILFVGNVIRRKGLHVVLEALRQLGGCLCCLAVAGSLGADVGYAKFVRELAAALPPSAVTFAGRVSDAELVRLYRTHHLLAAPAYEGFGIAYLEAMRFGLPVIASTAGAARELVTHAANGYLVAPEDASAVAAYLRQLALERQHLHTLGYTAWQTYRQHPTWQQSMQRIADWLPTLQRQSL